MITSQTNKYPTKQLTNSCLLYKFGTIVYPLISFLRQRYRNVLASSPELNRSINDFTFISLCRFLVVLFGRIKKVTSFILPNIV
jgi:hypothetical protein